jgi:hypothetical protein
VGDLSQDLRSLRVGSEQQGVDRHAAPPGLLRGAARVLGVGLAIGEQQHHARGARTGALLEARQRQLDAFGEVRGSGLVQLRERGHDAGAVGRQLCHQLGVPVELDDADLDVALRRQVPHQPDRAGRAVVAGIGAPEALRRVQHEEEVEVLHAAEDRGAALHLHGSLPAV